MYSIRAYTILFSLLLAIGSSSISQTLEWEADLDDNIRWLNPASDEILICGTKNEIHGLDVDDGSVIWTVEDFKSADKSFILDLKSDKFCLLVQYNLNMRKRDSPPKYEFFPYLIDFHTGKIIAEKESMGVRDLVGMYLTPKGNLLLFSYKSKKEVSMLVYDLGAGCLLWKDSIEFKDDRLKIFKNDGIKTFLGNQPPIFDSDSTMITCMNEKYIRKWNLRTGDIIWKKKFKKKHLAPADGFAEIIFDPELNLMFIPNDRTLLAVSSVDGEVVWKSYKFKNRIEQLVLCDSSIAIVIPQWKRIDQFYVFTTFSKRTGAPGFQTETISQRARQKTDFQGLIYHKGEVLYYDDEKVYRFDLVSGSGELLCDDINFDHNENPREFFVFNNHYYLTSPQNIMCLTESGNMEFHTSVKPPGPGLGIYLLEVAHLAASIALTINSDRMSFGYGYESFLPNDSTFRKSTQGEKFTYMITNRVLREDETAPGIVKVNMFTGEIASEIMTGDKIPMYAVDKSDRFLYIVNDKKNVACYAW